MTAASGFWVYPKTSWPKAWYTFFTFGKRFNLFKGEVSKLVSSIIEKIVAIIVLFADDALDPTPLLGVVTFFDTYVVPPAFVIYALIKVYGIHKRGNTPRWYDARILKRIQAMR